MKKVVLKDGTEIVNCTDSTTSNEIYALRSTFAEAGAVLDKVTPENASCVKVYDADGNLITEGSDLVFVDRFSIRKVDNGVEVAFFTRVKTEMEVVHDEISELQEVVLEG